MSKQTYLTKRFNSKLEEARAEVASFVVKVQHDAAYALTWSNAVFSAAAKERVYTQVLVFISDSIGEDPDYVLNIDEIINVATDRVLNKAKYPAQSTSPTSNLIEQYELAAWAEILSDLNSFKEFDA